ncbi:hypothetical protein AXFE_04300 [Acidithrix ferrooxidans]|uniref:Uncharacterized protein n=1 Tax=Acidithrix ferrooxidans TaxID=1280514 RepID=A0A0D8HL96_9ACTN|nr:hypothetical protein AXFE_04300 [Acidithrix ferrooxidans]
MTPNAKAGYNYPRFIDKEIVIIGCRSNALSNSQVA